MTTIDVFAHEVCDGSTRGEDARWIFCPGACSRGKTFTLNLVRTESPTHTEVRVFPGFCKKIVMAAAEQKKDNFQAEPESCLFCMS